MKKLTKTMAMLVVLVMATGMVAFPAFAEETFATEKNVFVADTFERGVTEETEITSLGAGTLAAASGVTIVNDSAYGNVLRVNREIGDTGEGDKFVITYSVGGANKIVTDMDFKINQDVHYVYSAITLCKDGTFGGADENAAWNIFKQNNVLTASGNIALTGTDFDNKWYSARVIYDRETGKTDWYVAERGEALAYKGSYINESKPVPGRFLIAALGQGSDIYIDNLKVYEYEKDDLARIVEEAEKDLRIAKLSPSPAIYDTAAVTAFENAINNANATLSNPASKAAELYAVVNAVTEAQKAFILSEQYMPGVAHTRFDLDNHVTNTDVLYGDGSTFVADIDDSNDQDKAIRGNFATALNMTGGNNRVVIDSYQKVADAGAEGFFLGADVTTLDFAFKATQVADMRQLMKIYAGGASPANTVFVINSLYGSKDIAIECKNASGVDQRVVIIEDYDADKWYNIKVTMNFKTSELEVYVNGEKLIFDEALYFAGTGVLIWNYSRIESYGPSAGTVYLAGLKVHDDRARIVGNLFEAAKAGVPADVTSAAQGLPETADGVAIAWSSADFMVDGATVSAGDAKGEGVLTATINFNNADYSENYVLPVAIGSYSVEELALNEVDGEYKALATLKKSSLDMEEVASLIIATYDSSNKLVAVKIVDNSNWMISAGDVATMVTSLDAVSGGKAKAFVFVRNVLKPLCAEVEAY